MLDNVTSGEEYAELIINEIVETELDLPAEERMDADLLRLWCEQISIRADKTWVEYVSGAREHFAFTDDDMSETFHKAGEEFADVLIDGLIDKDMLQVVVNPEGNFLIELTESGKQMAEFHKPKQQTKKTVARKQKKK